ncbi:MAG: DUF1611 domain-containing protein [Pseudomonadota bacterium]
MSLNQIHLRPPYLVFVANEHRPSYAKTGLGLVHWRREFCAGQLRLSDDAIDLGLPDMDIAAARAAGVNSLLVGTAQIGGAIDPRWQGIFETALDAGMDIVAGLHRKLASIASLKERAEANHTKLVDVRTPPPELPVGTGEKRTGRRLLTVGTDCALGKKYTALYLERALKHQGLDATFRASGQTGIMIAGEGIPIDCVVADFISGAAECLSPANSPSHWDVIEGQGSIFHPGYAAVTHGLLLGSQPDAFVVCHAAGRKRISGWDGFPLPSIGEVIKRTISIGAQVNQDIRCVGLSVNCSALAEADRRPYLDALEDRYGLPATDPVAEGIDGPIRLISGLSLAC